MIRAISSFFVVMALWITTATAQQFPTHQGKYVNDFAELLSSGQEAEIRDMLAELAQQRGIEFTVVTINRLSDYDQPSQIEPFATGLFNHWGVGDASRNDGLMLLVSRYDRKLRIEVGSGYGTSKNAPMKTIIDNVIVPQFRNDDYPAGIKAGVEAVIYDVTGFWPGQFDASAVTRWTTTVFRTLGAWLLTLLLPVGGFAVWGYRKYQRAKPRYCPIDQSRMGLVLEEYEDNHLKAGQITEEDLDSIQYDVWKCSRCEHVTVEGYRKWVSRYGACRECRFKTVEGDSVTERHATTTSTGRRRTDYSCRHCDARYSTYSTIPMRTKSSSSSGSSGGSFGGGSSSGGGASGSW